MRTLLADTEFSYANSLISQRKIFAKMKKKTVLWIVTVILNF
jgi:hypothetical protein